MKNMSMQEKIKKYIWYLFIVILGYFLNGFIGILGSFIFFHDSYLGKTLELFGLKKLYIKYEQYKNILTFFIIPTLHYFWNIDWSFVITILIAYYFVFLAQKAIETKD